MHDPEPDPLAVDTAEPTDEAPPPRGRWPLGLLTLIAVGAVAVGVLVMRNGDDAATAGTTVPSLDVPAAIKGEPAPDFALDLLNGDRFRLSDHLETDGRPVLLNLWASWCGPCRAEMPALDAASQLHPEVFFLGVAVEDDPVAAQRFADEIGVGYALAIDEADRVARRYPSFGLPATFLIGPDGTIVTTVYGQVDESQLGELLVETFG